MPKVEQSYINKPWGWELIFAHTQQYVGKVIFIKKGELLSRQYHQEKDESVYVVDGPLIIEIGRDGDERIELKNGESFHIPPNTIHRYIAPDNKDCKIIEVSTPQLDDVVRLEDRYGRTN